MELLGVEFLFLFYVFVEETDDGAADDVIFLPQYLGDLPLDPHLDEFVVDLASQALTFLRSTLRSYLSGH